VYVCAVSFSVVPSIGPGSLARFGLGVVGFEIVPAGSSNVARRSDEGVGDAVVFTPPLPGGIEVLDGPVESGRLL